ncbi:DUF305 domain-containing protein [Burkholderia singularis]|uniref:DUF305 domain-containing protein n=1 Tax=Burkholderia singularis TaxID=1503053 RepID=A0A103E5U4_9BURK|nr:DUF4142 domain-containing protein [Burkholderia singularis]KVE28946.1 DUF305 domain-containing protein [Burkholderia singularis]
MNPCRSTWRAAAAVIAFALGDARAQMPGTDAAPNAPLGADVVNPAPDVGDSRIAKPPRITDAEFVDEAALAGKSEIQASQLAGEQSATADVRAFAKMMIDDHSKIDAALRAIASHKRITPRTSQVHDPNIEVLRGKRGHDFDVAYLAAAGPAAHRRVIQLFEQEASSGSDADLRAFAQQTLPTLHQHLRAAQALAREVQR